MYKVQYLDARYCNAQFVRVSLVLRRSVKKTNNHRKVP